MAQDSDTHTDPQGQIILQKVYSKGISFESPLSPAIFSSKWNPAINMELLNKANPLGNDMFEVVLTMMITAKLEDKTVFLIELQQAGIFLIKAMPREFRKKALAITCASILFPFARGIVADLVQQGGFPQFLLQPINFEQLYAEKEAQASKQNNPPPEKIH